MRTDGFFSQLKTETFLIPECEFFQDTGMGRVFYVIILSIDRQTCSGACLKNKGDTHGFQLDALSMDLSALSTGSILYKSRKNPKWNPGIFQSAFLCMGRAALCFPYAVFRGGEFYRRNSD